MSFLSATRTSLALFLAAGGAALFAPSLAAARPPELPSLLAKAVNPATGAPEAKRLRLDLLNPKAFRVVRRPSAASVTLGWPAQQPCAFTTFRLSILPAASDAEAVARAVVPVAEGEGRTAWLGATTGGTTRPTLTGAWRVHSELPHGDRMTMSAVAATPLVDRYGHPVGGLVQLSAQGRTVPKTRCSGTNQFSIGPNVISTVQVAASA